MQIPLRIILSEMGGFSADALAFLHSLGAVAAFDIRDRSELIVRCAGADVLWIRLRHRIDAEVMSAAPQLRAIVSPTTGLDHIDIDEAEARGITVLSLRGESEFLDAITATSELTWALLLELARQTGAAHANVLHGYWNRDAWRGRSLKGRTLGLLGHGRLGRIVGEYGHAFRMPVIAHDPYVSDYPTHVRPVSFDELLATADILSVHVPLNASTEGLLDASALSRMKRGAWLINTSRGRIVDDAALVDALRAGHLGAAALDVLGGETGDRADWLMAHPAFAYAQAHDNLILTPHIGGATAEAMAETEMFMARKLKAHLLSGACDDFHNTAK